MFGWWMKRCLPTRHIRTDARGTEFSDNHLADMILNAQRWSRRHVAVGKGTRTQHGIEMGRPRSGARDSQRASESDDEYQVDPE